MNAIAGAQGVRIERVSKSYGGVTAVDDVSLDLAGGEFFSLLGPSGCGKTTLLRILAGFERPDSGRIWVGGADVTDLPPERRPTNMVFQSYALFPHLDVAANIAYGLRRDRLSKAAAAERVAAALALVRLNDLAGRRPEQLSGGQRQRVALARALVKRPRVLLLDEPLSALDKKLREAMQQELRALQRQVGITFVFVTHDQDEAFAMSDRIAVMDRGKVLQVATPENLYRQPSCREVASFVGAINLIPGRVSGTVGSSVVIDAGPLGRLPTSGQHEIAPGTAVTIAIRPEQIAVAEGSVKMPGEPSGTVLTKTFLGDRIFLGVEIEGLPSPLLLSSVSTGEIEKLIPGASVNLRLKGDFIVMRG